MSISKSEVLSMIRQPKDAKMASEQMIKIFSKICAFVSELNTAFGSKFHFVELYNHLLLKTKLSKKQSIQQHIEAFRQFFDRNKDAILAKDVNKIMSHRISYSERVFIDIYAILTSADTDSETSEAIWNHLLVINATIDPSSEAKEMLRKLQTSDSAEGKLLGNFFDRIQQGMGDNGTPADPMSAVASIMQSGVMNDMIGSINKGVQDRSLDLGKLFQTVQGMLSGFASMSSSDQSSNPLSGMGGGNGLDIGGMLGMLMQGGMMGQNPGSQSSSSSSFSSSLNVDKMKESIDMKIEAEAKREMSLGALSAPITPLRITDANNDSPISKQ